MSYDVFISYSHGDDDLLCERVQDALSKFAKPWYRRRALNVFRDRTGLSANPGLWTSISDAIDGARYFLFLASPDAAASVWCGREVAQWRAKHGSEGMLILLTDGEILWNEHTNDFDWATTTALGAAFAGCFAEEPFHIDMRWARSETQLDLTDGRFRDQIADLAAPVHGMAKDELASEDVRQHRRALRQAVGAGIALVLLTIAAVATSVYAVNAAARARKEEHIANVQAVLAAKASIRATKNGKLAEQRGQLAETRARDLSVANGNLHTANKNLNTANSNLNTANSNLNTANTNLNTANTNLNTANTNLTKGSLALRKSTLLAEARLAARRSEQLMSSGDQTYQLGVLLAAEAVRHACASSAIDPASTANAADQYPNPGCALPGIQIDGSVANSALISLANAGGRFVTDRLTGSTSPYLVSWSSDGSRLATFSSAQSSRPQVVQVWNADGSLAASATSDWGLTRNRALSGDGNVLALTTNAPGREAAVSAWSLTSRLPMTARGLPGRSPALSANGDAMAWLAPRGAKSVEISVGQSTPRTVVLPSEPVEVAVSGDGSLAAALVSDGGDNFSLIPIDVATGKVGVARPLGSFGTPQSSFWSNPPMVAPGETADPPALSFTAAGSTVWVYNNERHVGVQLARSAAAPTARVAKVRVIPPALDSGSLIDLRTSTPDGRVVVMLIGGGTVPTYEVWTLSQTGWTTPGLVPVELCASDPCNLSIGPNGAELAVSSLSALQVIDVLSPASTSSGIVANQGAFPPGTSVVMAPTGQTAVSWSARRSSWSTRCIRRSIGWRCRSARTKRSRLWASTPAERTSRWSFSTATVARAGS